MIDGSRRPSRTDVLVALVGIFILAAIGYAISRGLAEHLLIGAGLVSAAIAVSALSPAAGISAVLIAAPTMYHLHPMPRGEFSLLELAILTGTLGITLHLAIDALRGGRGRLRDLFTPAQVVVPAALLLAAAGLTLVTLAEPAYRAETLREIRMVIVEPLLFLVVARMAMRREAVRTVAGAALILAGSVVSVYAIAQVALDLGGVQAGDLTRATATYTHPNNLALYLERTLLLTIGVGVVRPRWWPVWVVALVQLGGVALTLSRGALLALVAGIAIILLLRRLYAWLLLLIAGGIGAAGVGVLLFPDRFIDAGGAGAEPTRFTIWRASLRMALDHPLFGVGPDQFLYQYSRRYIEPMGWPERWTSHPHNLFLDVWLRLGVAGVAAFASLAVGLVWWIRRHLRVVRDDVWAMGAIGALVGGLAHGMLDNGFFLPDLATLTWFFVALIVTVPPSAERVQATSPGISAAVARTWPGHEAAVARYGGDEVAQTRLSRRWVALAALVLAFVVAPVVSGNPYLPFLMIALAGLATILNPAVGIAGVIASIPIQDAVMVPFVRGELTITQIVLFGTVLGWAVTLNRYRIWLDSIVVGFLAVIAALSVSLVEMDSPGLWFGEAYRWASAGLFYIICRSVLTSWERIRIVLAAMALGLMGTAGYVIWEWYDFRRSPFDPARPEFRAFGTFGVPNPLAAYVEFTVLPLLVFALLGFRSTIRRMIGRWFWFLTIAAVGAGMFVLALTQSRGGMIGIAFGLVAVFLILPRKIQLGSIAAGVLLMGMILVTPLGQSQLDRFVAATGQEENTVVRNTHQGTWGRQSLWLAGYDMTRDKPLTGVGAGEFDYHYREYVRVWVDRFPAGQAHNAWLQMGAQAGIPGIIAFTIWLAATLHSLLGAFRRASEPLARLLSWGAFAALVAFTIHSLVDYLNVLSLGLQISAVVAIGLNLSPNPLAAISSPASRFMRPGDAETDVVPAS